MGADKKIGPAHNSAKLAQVLLAADDANAHDSLNAAAAVKGLGRIVLDHHCGDIEPLSDTHMAHIGQAIVSLGVLVEKIAEGLSNDLGAVRSELRDTGGDQ